MPLSFFSTTSMWSKADYCAILKVRYWAAWRRHRRRNALKKHLFSDYLMFCCTAQTALIYAQCSVFTSPFWGQNFLSVNIFLPKSFYYLDILTILIKWGKQMFRAEQQKREHFLYFMLMLKEKWPIYRETDFVFVLSTHLFWQNQRLKLDQNTYM